MAQAPQILKKFKVSVQDVGYLGLADEITLPKLTVKTREVSAGLAAPLELDVGQLEKLEGSMVLLEYNAELLKLFGGWDSETITITARGAIQAQGKAPQPVMVRLTGFFKEMDMGNWKDGEESKLTLAYTVQKYQLKINNQEIYNIDLYNNTRVINGRDQMAALRAAIGE